MPVDLIDPVVHAQGAGIGPSPLAAAFSSLLGGYGKKFPTMAERAQMEYHNAQTQKLQQEMGASQQLSDIFSNALNPQATPDMNAAPVEGPRPSADFVGPEPGIQPMHTPKPDEIVRANLPGLIGAMQAGGHIANAPQLARMMAGYVPGSDTGSMTMPMLAAGDSYESTPGGMREKNQMGFTSEQKNRTNKISEIMKTQGVELPIAEGLVDGVLDLTTDQAGNRVLVNKATGASKLLYSMASGASDDARGGASPQPATPGAAPTTAPGAAPPNSAAIIGNTIGLEGGLAATDGASGAPAIFGINAKWHPNEFAQAKQLNDTQGPEAGKIYATNFYKKEYWDANGLDALPGPTAAVVFDGLVNHYPGFGQKLLGAAEAGATPQQLIQMRAKEYARLGAVKNPDGSQPYAASVPGWTQRLKTLSQQVGGMPAAADTAQAGQPAPAATPVAFKMSPGDLGLPFDTMYGGPAVASRAAHTVSSFIGDQTPDPALAAFGKLNTLKNGLVNAMSVMPGRASNEGMQKRLLEQFPETDSNLIEMQNGVEQGGINPADAEQKFNQGVEEGVALYQQADESLKNKYLDQKTRDAYQTVKSTVQKTLLNTLPDAKYKEFSQAVGIIPQAPVADMSNLEKGKVLTTKPTEAVPTKADAAALPVGAIFPDKNPGIMWRVVSPGKYERVK